MKEKRKVLGLKYLNYIFKKYQCRARRFRLFMPRNSKLHALYGLARQTLNLVSKSISKTEQINGIRRYFEN